MATSTPNGWTGNPNSGNQRWSRWAFTIAMPPGRLPSEAYVRDNARRFFTRLFGSSAGQVRVLQAGRRWTVQLRIEGPSAIDPGLRDAVKRQFVRDFLERGLRGSALLALDVGILAGSRENGRPPDHLIVLPPLVIDDRHAVREH